MYKTHIKGLSLIMGEEDHTYRNGFFAHPSLPQMEGSKHCAIKYDNKYYCHDLLQLVTCGREAEGW